MTNTITATITASQFNAMTKAALFAFAAEKGIKVLKKMDKATLVQTIMADRGQQPAEAPAEAPTEQVEEIVVLGSILGGVNYDDLAEIVEIVEEEEVVEEVVAPTTPEPVQPVAVGSYVKWVKGPSYFKVNRYGYKESIYTAELVSKKNPTDKELSFHYVPADFIGAGQGVTFVPVTRQEVALAYKAKQAPKSAPKKAPVVRETTHANSKRFVVNVTENRFGYRNWSITDKVTKNTFPVEEGKSVTRMVRSYQARVKGVAAKVTITENVDQPVRGANAAPTCPCCQTGLLTHPVLSFFEKNRSKLPAELQAIGPVCYKCQDQTGMRKYFAARTQVAVR